jgi:Protein of unknown function (DUF2939)
LIEAARCQAPRVSRCDHRPIGVSPWEDDCRRPQPAAKLASMKKIGGVVLLLALVGAYIAYPYLTLGRLVKAIDDKSTAELKVLVDWPAVRAAAKTDFRTLALSSSSGTASPDFGSVGAALGVMMGSAMIDSYFDAYISARGLVDFMKTKAPPEMGRLWSVSYAFFASPSEFRVDVYPVRAPEKKFTLLMSLSGASWRVTRVILPLDQIMAEKNTPQWPK